MNASPMPTDLRRANSLVSPSRAAFGRIDPRLYQIATLAGLLTIGIVCFDLDAGIGQAIVTLLAAITTQAAVSRIQRKRLDWRSPIITGLSLTLLLRAHNPLLWAVAGVVGIGSKCCVRIRGKHLFNPAAFAIVTLLLLSPAVWISPGQWGALAWGAAALASAAGLILSRARRLDLAATFLLSWSALLVARCMSLGDPWSIPLHQMQSGALLVFACFMITDPRSTPDSAPGRLLFAMAVAALGHHLQFQWQLREGLFYALIIVSFATPLLDRAWPAGRFHWKPYLQEA